MFLLWSWFVMLLLGAAHHADGRVPAFAAVTMTLVVALQIATTRLDLGGDK